jgi:hypothetical protein
MWVALAALIFLLLVAPISGWVARKALGIWPDSRRAPLPFEIAIMAALIMTGIWLTRTTVSLHSEDYGQAFAVLGAILTVPICFIVSLIGASRGIDHVDRRRNE